MSTFFLQAGKAFVPTNYRAIIFSFGDESARTLMTLGYSQDTVNIPHRASLSAPSEGYFVGGSLGVSQSYTRINFISETSAVVSGLSRRHPRSLGAVSAHYGYVFGANTLVEDKQGDGVDKIDLINESVMVGGDLLTPGGAYATNLWNVSGGTANEAYLRADNTAETVNVWSRYDYLSEVHSVLGAVPAETAQTSSPSASSETAIFTPVRPSNLVEKFDKMTQVVSVVGISTGPVLPTGPVSKAAISGPIKGYFVADDGNTYGLNFLSETQETVSTGLQGSEGTALVSFT
jgi:hypothetical protein